MGTSFLLFKGIHRQSWPRRLPPSEYLRRIKAPFHYGARVFTRWSTVPHFPRIMGKLMLLSKFPWPYSSSSFHVAVLLPCLKPYHSTASSPWVHETQQCPNIDSSTLTLKKYSTQDSKNEETCLLMNGPCSILHRLVIKQLQLWSGIICLVILKCLLVVVRIFIPSKYRGQLV